MAFEKIILGGGCFWCLESVFRSVKGVSAVVSGYTGGHIENPTYEQTCSGQTGHAEVIEVTYDNEQISLGELLQLFFTVHDPTTLNRQGNDIGTQYRSAIFYANDEQKTLAEDLIRQIEETGVYQDKIVTRLESFTRFYPAEEYHQNYFEKNPENAYCQSVIPGKRAKLLKAFAGLVRE